MIDKTDKIGKAGVVGAAGAWTHGSGSFAALVQNGPRRYPGAVEASPSPDVLESPRPAPWARRLADIGGGLLGEVGPWVESADPELRVAGRSRLLCTGLAELALVSYRALGGTGRADDVGVAAALLSLLTKIDDQVIDDWAFHGGMAIDRLALRERTERYLAPTLRSIREASPATDEPRCAMAAELGRRIRRLGSDPARRARLLETIARGWAIQVKAVATFTAHPREVTEAEVADVTANISGLWLTMIAMVGTLPDDAARPLSSSEERAFLGYGGHIQRADALADLARDVADGLVSTVPGLHNWRERGATYLDTCVAGEPRPLYEMTAETGADRACLPTATDLDRLDAQLAGLGELPSLLRWIHGFLLGRYLAHPACRRSARDPRFAPFTWRSTPSPEPDAAAGPDSILAYLDDESTGVTRCSAR